MEQGAESLQKEFDNIENEFESFINKKIADFNVYEKAMKEKIEELNRMMTSPLEHSIFIFEYQRKLKN